MSKADAPLFELTDGVASALHAWLRAYGEEGAEGMALLCSRHGDPPHLLDLIAIPRYEAFSSLFGCGISIDAASLTRLGQRLHKIGYCVRAMMHSHPEEASHSPTDDRNVFMRFHNALSIVVPDFGARKNLLDAAAIFLFDVSGPSWHEVRAAERTRILKVVPGNECEVMYDDEPMPS